MPSTPLRLSRVLEAPLRVPLLWKLLLANAGLLAVAGTIVTRESGGVESLSTAVVLTVVGIALVNALLVWLALRPVERLIAAAKGVSEGQWSSRIPPSPLADRKVDRLRMVLNEMLDAVARARARERELSRRVLETEERERERVAHELYAGTAQTLADVLVRLRLLHREVGAQHEYGSLDLISDEVREALEEIRGVARRLRPPELDELGVRAALEAHARRLTEGSSGRVDFHGAVERDALSDEGRLALFRIVQEGVSNAIRHSGGSRVQVRFLQASDGVVVEIEDNGRGFQCEGPTLPAEGLGLTGMVERARHAGGAISVDSVPGRGTRVRLVLPRRPSDEGAGPRSPVDEMPLQPARGSAR